MPMLKNIQHEHFAELVAKGEKPGRAYVAAGFSEKGADQSGHRLMRTAKVSARIAELRVALAEPVKQRAIELAVINKTWVVERLKEVTERCMQHEPVLDKKGQPTGEYVFNAAGANRALELLGKELGMFVERKEIGGPGDFERMPLEELREFVAREAAELAPHVRASLAKPVGGPGLPQIIDVEPEPASDCNE